LYTLQARATKRGVTKKEKIPLDQQLPPRRSGRVTVDKLKQELQDLTSQNNNNNDNDNDNDNSNNNNAANAEIIEAKTKELAEMLKLKSDGSYVDNLKNDGGVAHAFRFDIAIVFSTQETFILFIDVIPNLISNYLLSYLLKCLFSYFYYPHSFHPSFLLFQLVEQRTAARHCSVSAAAHCRRGGGRH
jgi:hypothetical protein